MRLFYGRRASRAPHKRRVRFAPPNHGDLRQRQEFLWLPLVAGGWFRWLEAASYEEKWSNRSDYMVYPCWDFVRWLDAS